ncbi:methylthioribulose-1-phosphate dehydratase [Candidatus Nitrosoglobus terrae]|uniref:Methylthioribulose-1-phosphate dehydratase n=1 Tax=Candidatus Nitrosoglobus terrae TaxID=1630141 RepID=A0A1Q2SNY9_9GAMM|nr:methylthioribulose 1-phosphate dehydratase [Candidatus Nitrosoglobus terrae]BAW80841.1 methylthioribulose-1-phosphate dehydratase [Candidatus Nitrosoglobus terrae]
MNEGNAHLQQTITQLIDAGRFFFDQGWVPATSGNFSARLASTCMIVTVSGWHKGQLNSEGMLVTDFNASPLSATNKRPSAEALLHGTLYRRFPEINAIFHTHSVYATVLSCLLPNELILSDYELLKILPGIKTHQISVRIPIFPNDQDISRLSIVVDDYLAQTPDSPGYLIAGHGLYTWGGSVEQARHRVEALEFLFECEVLRRRL